MMQLGVEGDLKRCGKKGCSSGAVTLMTLHGAKGLEFPVTMICGVEQGKIPLESEAYSTDLEEERRLLYVGMTRAKEELILVSANKESEFFEKVNDNLIQKRIGIMGKQEETARIYTNESVRLKKEEVLIFSH